MKICKRNINAIYKEGPSYPYKDEEGFDCHTWDYIITVEVAPGKVYTLKRTFDHVHEFDLLLDTCLRISSASFIHTENWNDGTPWDRYLIPQTWDEEKAAHYERCDLEGIAP